VGFLDDDVIEDDGGKSALDQQIEKDQRDRERFMEGSSVGDLYEIPDKLEPREAIWYYNVMDDRRDEVYHMHFSRLKRLEDWLEVYTNSKEETPARELAFTKLAGLQMDYDGWIELYESRFNDERIVTLVKKRLEQICGDLFDKWLGVYDYAPYASQIQQLAGRKLKSLAKNIEHWQALYDRSEIGSPLQINALQQILLLSRFEQIKRTDREEEEFKMLAHAASKGPKEWFEEYEKSDFYSSASEIAVLNIYLSADMKSEAASPEEEAAAG
jgi:hypothetical protein